MFPKREQSLVYHRQDRIDITHEIWKEMAGQLYDDFVRSKEFTLAHVFDADSKIRSVAISMCHLHWNYLSDPEFLNACEQIAAADSVDSVRIHAIDALGAAWQSSQNPSVSLFLANIVKDCKNSEQVRRAAYWALREIQLGSTEEDAVKRSISLAKLTLNKLPAGMTEEEVKHRLLCNGRFPESVWDSADEIDWRFVDQYASG